MRDVADLPTYAFGTRSDLWWGTAGFIAIEGTVFVLMVVAYFYLMGLNGTWPASAKPPGLLFSSLFTAVLLLSALPNALAKAAAEREDLARTRLWSVVTAALGVGLCGLRAFEFTTLNVRWDANAYGSVTWVLLGLHTTHLLTDLADSIVLVVLIFTRRMERRHFVDVSENAIYWDFVVAAWLPIWGVIYFAPRLS